MARFRAPRRLTCFYCGKPSGLKNDGAVRDFLCLHCDATNYLDENGEITDPPVATDREAEATTTQYAAPKQLAPTDSTFCQTCLKNQHLFTKSLAQYFPDDPSDPEYPALERNYYRYRRGLEQRYPQVCDECAERVEQRIRQAGYTAKTDHLRRMMDLSRGRKPTRRRTLLDWVSSLGRTTWKAGFVLQLLWHLVTVVPLLQRDDGGMRDPDGDGYLTKVLAGLTLATELLPAADSLIQWSIAAAFLSAWWNPHFVQVNRGFTKHLLGFTQWYSFQGLIVFFRLVFRRVLDIQGGQAQSLHAQLSAHMVMAAGMGLIYSLAGKSIRVDTSPLFDTYEKPVLPKQAKTPAKRKQEDSKTFSELFNDALESANATPLKQPQFDLPPSPQDQFNPARPDVKPATSFGNAGLPGTPTHRPQQVQYAEEMDWSPIPAAPQHRAFASQSSPSRGARTFGQTQAQPEGGNPFWYKVPAAPVNPARRLRNPTRAPEPKEQPAETNKVVLERRRREPAQKKRAGDAGSGVEFRQPKFFAPASEADDASSLADLLNQSFSLSQEQDEEEDAGAENGAALDGTRHMRNGKINSPSSNSTSNRPDARPVEPVVLAGLVATWLLTLALDIPYELECQTAIMAIAGIIALRSTGDASQALEPSPHPAPAAYVLSALGIAELAAVCWVASEAWKGETPQVGLYGAGVLAAMLGHQTLRQFV